MKFKVIGVLVILSSFSSASEGLPFGNFGLATVAEYEPSAELKRDKRTLTTICVEIKPSSPYEEPYFMCKGTDSPKHSKDTSSDSYSAAKPSYKPSKPSKPYASGESDSYHSEVTNTEYHGPSKSDYPVEPKKYEPASYETSKYEPSKYEKQSSYESEKEYSGPSKPSYGKKPSYDVHHSEAHYEAPAKPYAPSKPSYVDQHGNEDEYSSKPYHKVIYEKPSPVKQSYSHQENPSPYDHRHPTGYSKPSQYDGHSGSGGYSKPSSSYESGEYSKPSVYDQHSTSHDSKPSYSGDSYSKPSYSEHDGHSYSSLPETKVLYSKPTSYPAKQSAYEHGDHSKYDQPKPTYSGEQPSSKPYSKPTHDYGKPASYAPHEPHSGYAPQSHNYRMMPQELLQPTWEAQPEQLQSDGFGYRSLSSPMEYQNQENLRMMNPESQLYTGIDGPMRFDLSGTHHQEAPILQSPYSQQAYSSPVHQVTPSYAPPVHYAPQVPSYPAYHPAQPTYTPPQPAPYIQTQVPLQPTYAPVPPLYASDSPSYGPTAPTCPQNYMCNYQPVIMSIPCYSLPSYGPPAYSQPLGSPQSQHSTINPLQERTSSTSENNSDTSSKSSEDRSQDSQETDKKSQTSESESTPPKKTDNLKHQSDSTAAEEKQPSDKIASQDQPTVGAEKSINEPQNVAPALNPPAKTPEAPHTKDALNAMMKMARIAAQMNKDDTQKTEAADSASSASSKTNEKIQFSRSQ